MKPVKHLNLNLDSTFKSLKSASHLDGIFSGNDPGIVMHPQDLKRLQKSMSSQVL
jgi:hypothetical protein